MPIPINNAHSGEKGSGTDCAAGSAFTGAAESGGIAVAAVLVVDALSVAGAFTALSGISRVSGGYAKKSILYYAGKPSISLRVEHLLHLHLICWTMVFEIIRNDVISNLWITLGFSLYF